MRRIAIALQLAAFSLLSGLAHAQNPPASQIAVQTAVTEARRAFDMAPNDMARGATRRARARALCAALPTKTASNWIGEVALLSSTPNGKGVLYMRIGDDISLNTDNSNISEGPNRTLIDPGSSLFDVISRLTVGQKVRFSGNFLPGRDDCFRESSLTQRSAMVHPDFIFRFTAITPLS
ncbi:MAG TPA: hypothetical protein VIL69_19910 [Roseomonas sp.]|jgi:hypothetical protein